MCPSRLKFRKRKKVRQHFAAHHKCFWCFRFFLEEGRSPIRTPINSETTSWHKFFVFQFFERPFACSEKQFQSCEIVDAAVVVVNQKRNHFFGFLMQIFVQGGICSCHGARCEQVLHAAIRRKESSVPAGAFAFAPVAAFTTLPIPSAGCPACSLCL